MTIRSAALVLFLGIAATGCGRGVDASQQADAVRAVVATAPAWVDDSALGRKLWKLEQQFYDARGYRPAWIDGDRNTPQLKDLVSQLHYSERHGLDPATYHVQEFEQAREESQTSSRGTRFDLARVPELDAKATYAYLRYAADLLGWTRSPKEVYENWLEVPKKDDLVARLNTAIGDHVRDTLEQLAPTHPQYKGLQAALLREREVPSGHADQLKMNLERWRWAPRDLGSRYVLVNVPAYQMQVMEGDDKPVLAMRVIVGKPDHATPLFSDEMTYVVFSPYWNIPESIIRKETLPRVAKDPSYLSRNQIEVVTATSKPEPIDPSDIDWSDEHALKGLRFRQAPGDENALGLVKFIFPNHFNVYLHDTPTDSLFAKDIRALSHGCVRLEQPQALARYVMGERPEWTTERIDAAMHARTEETVTLKTPIPVHIGYWTAWVDADGKTVTYTDDPYKIDQAQAGLIGRIPAPREEASE